MGGEVRLTPASRELFCRIAARIFRRMIRRVRMTARPKEASWPWEVEEAESGNAGLPRDLECMVKLEFS